MYKADSFFKEYLQDLKPRLNFDLNSYKIVYSKYSVCYVFHV